MGSVSRRAYAGALVVRTLVVLAVAGAAVGVWEVRADYMHLWSVWAGGGTTGNLSLWGLPMVWWGRIGKLLQFAAGLVVILDLISTEALRAFGERATARWRASRDYFRFIRLFRTWRLGRKIYWSLYDTVQVDSFRGNPIMRSFVRSDGPTPLKRPPKGMEPESLAEFQQELWTLVRADHFDTPRPAWEKYHPVIFKFLQDKSPPRKQITSAAFSRWTRWEGRLSANLIPAAFMLLLVALLSQPGRYVTDDTRWAWILNLLIVIPALGSLFILDYVPMLLLSVVLAPVAFTARLTARLMDRQRPGHQLRWAAFLLFIVGFHFDLLSS